MQDKQTPPPGEEKTATDAEQFKAEEQAADKGWEEEKDTISGVNKKVEHKLATGTLKPEDLENTGG